MIQDSIRRTPRPQDLVGMSTQELRDTFHLANLFTTGQLNATFTDLDRLVVGGVMPTDKAIELPNHKETGRAVPAWTWRSGLADAACGGWNLESCPQLGKN